jgi:hypothetical protein
MDMSLDLGLEGQSEIVDSVRCVPLYREGRDKRRSRAQYEEIEYE